MNVLWVKDKKIGHEKQVKTLLDELSKTNNINLIEEDSWVYPDIIDDLMHLITLNFFRGIYERLLISNFVVQRDDLKEYKDIDIIIGAGRRTHSRILYLKKSLLYLYSKRNIMAISILSPGRFNKKKFDLICAPLHDKHKYKKNDNNVVFFEGSLVKVFDTKPDENIGFIGIGGKNSHFYFNDNDIYEQIKYVISIYPNKSWYIFNSRRTSIKFNNLMRKITLKNVFFIDIWVDSDVSYEEIIQKASIKFITQDSVNMVYESLSSMGETVLFNMNYSKKTKVVKQMHRLLENKSVGYVDKTNLLDNLKTMKIVRQKNKNLFSEVEKIAFDVDKVFKK